MTFNLQNYKRYVEILLQEFEASEPKKKFTLLKICSEVIISTQRMVSLII